MSGYNGFSKSNNAIDAENQGLLTASQVAKRISHGATAAGVKAILKSTEWHHSSKFYNQVDYYDLEMELEEAKENGIDLFTEIIKASKKETVKYRADIEWLEFSGNCKHPRVSKFSEKNIEVEEKGDWFLFHFADGSIKRKGMFSTGTFVSKIYNIKSED